MLYAVFPDLDNVIPVIVDVLREVIVNEATLMKTFYTAKGLILTKVYAF